MLIQQKSIHIILFILSFILQLTQSAIKFHNFRLNYANQGKANEIELHFQIENTLSNDGYIRVVLPQDISGANMGCKYVESSLNTCSPDLPINYKSCTIQQSGLASDAGIFAYFINEFKDSTGETNQELSKDYRYSIVIKSDSNLAIQTQPVPPVEVYAVSSNVDNFLVFDGTNLFANLHILPSATNTASLGQWNHSGDYDQNSQQTFQFTITPTQSKGFTVQVEFTNELFQFLADTCSTTTLQADQYYCEVREVNKIYFYSETELSIGTSYDFTVQVQIPDVKASSDINFYVLQGKSQVITEYSQSGNQIVSKGIQFGTKNLKAGFGLQLSGQASQSEIFALYKNDATDTPVYNSLNFEYEVSSSMLNKKYKMELVFGNNVLALHNSIKHNLPVFDTNNIQECSIDTTGETKLVCYNIGPLVTGTTYNVSVRIQILNAFDDFTGDGVNFGVFQMFPINEDQTTYYSTSSVDTSNTYAITNINIKTNLLMFLQNPANLNQAVHTKQSFFDALSIDGPGVKFKADNTPETLEFQLLTQESDFVDLISGSGVDIYTGADLIAPEDPLSTSCHSMDTAYNAGSQPTADICTATIVTEYSASALNLKYAVNGESVAENVFNGDGIAAQSFGFSNVVVQKFSDIYADESLDFYIGLVGQVPFSDGDASSVITYDNTFLINSYILNYPGSSYELSNINISISNFWADSAGTYAVSGDEFPAFIRLSGYFTAQEKTDTKQIAVFFDNFNTFQATDEDLESDQYISCQSNIESNILCQKQDGDSDAFQYIHLPRIIIELDVEDVVQTTNELQIIIPLATIPNKQTVKLRIASLGESSELLHISDSVEFNFSSISAVNIQDQNRQISGVTGYNYSIDSKQKTAGNVADTQFFLYHQEPNNGFAPNSGSDQGAALVYSAKWNFFQDENFSVDQTATALSNDPKDVCLTLSYQYPSDTIYPVRYILYCPLYNAIGDDTDSIIPVTSFTFPAIDGQKYPLSYSALSQNTGGLFKYHEYSEVDLATNVLTLSSNAFSFDFYKGQNSLKPLLYFQTTNELPKNVIFKVICQDCTFNFIIEEDLNSVSNFYPCKIRDNDGNILELQNVNGCIQRFEKTYFTVELNMENKQPAGSYQLQLGGIEVTDLPVTYQYFHMQTLSGRGFVIDETQSPSKIYYDFQEDQMLIDIKNLNFMIQHKKARSIIQFELTIFNRPVYEDETIVIDLDVLNFDNQSYIPKIVIKDMLNDNALSNDWLSCELVSFKEIVMVPKADLTNKNKQYLIELHNIYTPQLTTGYSMSVYLKNPLGKIILSKEGVSLPSTLPTSFMPLSQLVLQKKTQNYSGSLANLYFTIKPQVQTLNVNSFIYIYFPSYYPDDFGVVEPFCLIENTFTRCEFVAPRMLSIRDIPFELPLSLTFDLYISGLPIPEYSTAETFFVALDDDSDPSEVLEFGETDDVDLSNNGISTIVIEEFNNSDDTWIVRNDYSFKFQVIDDSIIANSDMIIDFPNPWIDKFQKKDTITCTFEGNEITPCNFNGHSIKFTIPVAITQGTSYSIGIQGFRNPHYLSCIDQQLQLTIQIAETTIEARSYLPSTNIGAVQFQKSDTNPLLWKWEVVTKDGEIQYQENLTDQDRYLDIKRNSYSQRLRLSLANDRRVDRDVTIKFTESLNDLIYFKHFPEEIKIQTGEYFIDVRIGILPNVTQGEYPIYWDTEQDRSIYFDNPPSIRVLVSEEKIVIPSPNIPIIKMHSEGYSLPIVIDMDQSPPYEKIIVESEIPIFPDLRLDYGFVSDYVFTVDDSQFSVYLKSDEIPVVVERETELQYTITDEESEFFTFDSQVIPIQLSDETPDIPQIDLQTRFIYNTKISFSVASSQITVIYWQVTLSNSLIEHTLESTLENIRKHHVYDKNEYDQLQFGRYIIDGNDGLSDTLEKIDSGDGEGLQYPTKFWINNLKSNTSYKITFWSQDLMFKQEQIKSEIFTTKDNGDYLFRISVESSENLEDSHWNAVACSLCYQFQYEYSKIRSTNEVYCDQDQLSEISSPNNKGSKQNNFYFYPYSEREQVQRSDITFNIDDLKQNTNDLTAVHLPAINTFLANYEMAGLSSISFDNQIEIHRPIFKNNGTIEVEPNSIKISDLQLHNNGIIWAIVEILEISIKGNVIYQLDPTFEQVRAGKNHTDASALASGFAIQQSAGEGVSFTFNGLYDNSHYRLAFYAQSEDPSQYKLISPLFTVETDTPVFNNLISFVLFSFILVVSIIL